MATKDSENLLQKRTKELAIIKASNELLEDVKKGLLSRENVDEGVLLQIDNAKKENLILARNTYGASEQEVNEATYHGPSVKEIKEYEKRLEQKGLTDEELHQKDISNGVVVSSSKGKKSAKKETGGTVTKEEKTEKPRRKRRTKKEIAESSKDEIEQLKDVVTEVANENKKVEIAENEPISINDITKHSKKVEDTYNIEDYDLSSIPSYVQYDMIPLPSKGECYSHKKSRVPVAYLTAADENIITAPNMYRDGKILDVILRRKILDKDFNVDNLCSGDRDAILLWLRATSYGDDFPIVASNPDTGIQYNTTIKLSDFKYKDFNLKSDENGLFEYITSGGDIIKFKFLNRGDEIRLREQMTANTTDKNKFDILKRCKEIKDIMDNIDTISDEDRSLLDEDVEEVITIIGEDYKENYDEIVPQMITEQMITYTYSINGNTDKDFIKNYIENMRVGDARTYRQFYNDNKPGVNLGITINIPESDGGGSFDTFLRIEDTIFINY